MKTLAVLLSACLLTVVSAYAEKRYVIKKIHDEGSGYFDLNKHGEVAFVGLDQQERQFVYLYSGGIIRQITEILPYRYSYYDLDLNDKGQIVWAMDSWEHGSTLKGVVMLWDGSRVRKVQDSLYTASLLPRINDSGTIVWHLQPYYGAYNEVYKNDGVTTRLTSQKNPNGWPKINNNGLIAWHGDSRDISQWANRIRYILPGETEVRVVPQALDEGSAGACLDELNNIVFNRLHPGSWYSIEMFNGTEVRSIADSVYQSSYSVSNGMVAYQKVIGGKIALFLYDGSTHTLLSMPGTDNYEPMVNSSGIVVWKDSKYQVYVAREGGTAMVGIDCHKAPRINDEGMIAFAGYDWDLYGSAIYTGEYKDVFDVTGKVVKDGSPGLGLKGVSVIIDNRVVATTDASGEFKCENLEPGTVTLSFSLAGYTFNPPEVGITLGSHYRITPDITGSQGSGVGDIEIDRTVRVFPNPANRELYIEAPDPVFSSAEINLYTIHGEKVLLTANCKFPCALDISGLSPGSYLLILKTREREVRRTVNVIR